MEQGLSFILVVAIVSVGIAFNSSVWGVEHLNPKERMQMAIEAGVDQFGGEEIPELLTELVNEGKVTEARIDASVRRLVKVKFQLGLFDYPFIEDIHTNSIIASNKNKQFGRMTQGECMVLLENKNDVLPLRKGLRLYVENISIPVASKFAEIVKNPEEADFAVIRLETPYQTLFSGPTAAFFHHGDLDFKEEEKKKILDLMGKVPTIVDIYLDRPAVIPEISNMSAALLGNFGATDEVLMEVLFGQISPKGKLPIEMPSSMESVKTQFSDLPYDSAKPLYIFGYGLNYGKR
jgi:beta-glucosidase